MRCEPHPRVRSLRLLLEDYCNLTHLGLDCGGWMVRFLRSQRGAPIVKEVAESLKMQLFPPYAEIPFSALSAHN